MGEITEHTLWTDSKGGKYVTKKEALVAQEQIDIVEMFWDSEIKQPTSRSSFEQVRNLIDWILLNGNEIADFVSKVNDMRINSVVDGDNPEQESEDDELTVTTKSSDGDLAVLKGAKAFSTPGGFESHKRVLNSQGKWVDEKPKRVLDQDGKWQDAPKSQRTIATGNGNRSDSY